MPNWKEVQNMMKQARTPQEKAEALRSFQENVPPYLKDAVMLTMSKGSNNNNVKLGDIAECDDPEVFERLKNLANG
jgi:hypothetical protein